MKILPFALGLACLTAVGPTPVLAQTAANNIPFTQLQGMAATAAVAMVTSTSNGDIVFRPSGGSPGLPVPWATVTGGIAQEFSPPYERDRILGDIGGAPSTKWANCTPVGDIHLSAIDVGCGILPDVNKLGWMDVPQGTTVWHAIGVGVDAASASVAHSSSQWAQVAQSEASIVSYYDPASSGVVSDLLGATVVEQRASDMGLGSTGVEVGDFDFAMGFFAENQGQVGSTIPHRLFTVYDRFFFTVARGPNVTGPMTAPWGNMDAAIPANRNTPLLLDQRTIYETTWIWDAGTSTGKWSTPQPWEGNGNLGLAPEHQIIALSMKASNDQVVFSAVDDTGNVATLTNGTRSPLAVYRHNSAMAGPLPLRDSNGALMHEMLTLQTQSNEPLPANGICPWDPERTALEGCVELAVPTDRPLTEPNPLGLSVAYRTWRTSDGTPTSDEAVHFNASGVAPVAGASDEAVFFYIRNTNATNTPLDLNVSGPGGQYQSDPNWYPIGSAPLVPGATTANMTLRLPLQGVGFVGQYSVSAAHIYRMNGIDYVSRRSFISRIRHD